MSTMNQKEYLKKYLSRGSDSNKKKKRKKGPQVTSNRVKIIDDDIDVNLFNRAVEEDMLGAGEDAPQIVGVIDDRPLELRIDDYRKSDLWKPVGSVGETVQIKSEVFHETPRDNSPIRQIRKSGDKDLSPVRIKTEVDSDTSCRGGDDLSPKRVKSRHPEKTLSGKRSGLQSSKEVVRELRELKRKEDESFKKMPGDVSGASAKTVYRDRKTGKVRDFGKEAEVERKSRAKEEERTEKYTRWGRGLKQVEDYKTKLTEDLHEMSKPLARYADDEDLERYLKEQERDGDPMLAYIRGKKRKENVEANKPVKPEYEGEFMPNRYGIRPGHRWDGVDRSNGYETKWIHRLNAQCAQQEDVYKWSTEDM